MTEPAAPEPAAPEPAAPEPAAPEPAALDPRARLPGLSSLLERPEVVAAVGTEGHAALVEALRAVLAEAREAVVAGDEPPPPDQLAAAALAAVDRGARRSLRPVINATGVLLHTNLGRAPLSPAAIAAMTAAAGPTNLEVDLASGERGGRGAVIDAGLARLTGAEACLVVNNGAAALVLALTVLGQGREVIISRGELVEIGGSFRLPDIMQTAGCVLREVGTTNRTHLDDYRHAITESTGAVLRVHPSNYRIDGFVHRPPTADIAGLARAASVPFLDDIGSGLLRRDPIAPDEPTAADAVAAGADLVIFSGDKLLGGPQAGILVGRAELVERCRRAPLARALRLDKLRMAALEATVSAHARDATDELPGWAMAHASLETLRERAGWIAAGVGGEVVTTEAVLGGGSSPGGRLPSIGVALDGPADRLAHRLRTGHPPVVARIVDDRLVADLRSVPPEHDGALTSALLAAVEPDTAGSA